MATGTTLATLLTKLKAAVGDSLTVGQQSDPLYKQLLSDKQKWLAGEYDFPFLRDRWNVSVAPDTRYYNFPTTTIDGSTGISIDFERPLKAFVSWTNTWIELLYGIDEIDEYNNLNPDASISDWPVQPNDPVQRWQYNGTEQFEIWPIPVSNQTLRFVGQRVLNPLVATTDTADLDDELIVLSVAVDLLLREKSAEAQMRLAAAQERLRSRKAVYSSRDREVVLGKHYNPRGRRPYTIMTVAGAVSVSNQTLAGVGSPEGVVRGNPGWTYYDTSSGSFWVKQSGTGTTTGWQLLIGNP